MSKVNEILNGRKVDFLFVAAASFSYYAAGVYQRLNIYDEGAVVYGAARILNGDIPYRDFWTLYAPGIYYVQAGLFRLFGCSMVTERVLSSIFLAASALFVYLITTQYTSRIYALLAWFLCLSANVYWDFGSPGAASICFCLLATLLLLEFLARPNKSYIFLCGFITGVAVLFRQDFGIYTLVAQVLTILSVFFLSHPLRKDGLKMSTGKVVRYVPLYLLGIFVVVTPAVIYFAVRVPHVDLYYAFIVFPRDVYSKVRSLPYPALFPNAGKAFSSLSSLVQFGRALYYSFLYYFPIAIYLLVILALLLNMRKAEDKKHRSLGILLILLQGLLFLNVARIRSDKVHALPMFTFAAILFASLLSSIPNAKICRYIRTVAIVLVLSATIEPVAKKIITLNESLILSRKYSFTLPRARHIYCKYESYQDAVEYIQDKVPPNERIFVGNYRHDRIFASDIIFYFLANRHSSTKYHELDPGVATTARVQQSIIQDLDKYRVRFIVLRDWNINEPNESSMDGGVTILDDFIRSNFVLDRRFEGYDVWKRI